MKILIAILASKRDVQYENIARDRWIMYCPAPNEELTVHCRFFIGRELFEQHSDERQLNAPDGEGVFWMIEKVKAMLQWAVNQEYDYVFKCDMDTYVCVPRLLKAFQEYTSEQREWAGYGEPYGGSGYWLGKERIKKLLDTAKPLIYNGVISRESEDSWVARNLKREGFIPFQDPRYHSLTNEFGKDTITIHWYMDGDRIVRFKERLSWFERFQRSYEESK